MYSRPIHASIMESTVRLRGFSLWNLAERKEGKEKKSSVIPACRPCT
ncbi:hypothetical protein I314_05109 [Cryptococcus bacillisporus CA1873]|uniref:Uncharacterized protein n=2 Tax=Cryptococcus gattii TaxID=552467 RepID=A0A0D0VEA3_CRYGA|nr:hypothetical protein I312_04816 [Cryptococcus bacillisporus CA1280]KIR59125.1 hypothetical protein I314_05109 [Cryptococcus bacillisporus CA1873]|eukprot:KIR59125.1 hypothetical protein I314_05109 [Cryptococcus gattii CA1873]